MNLRRLGLFLRPQPASCSACHLVICERVRRPCPRCGDTRRTIGRGWAESVTNKDLVG